MIITQQKFYIHKPRHSYHKKKYGIKARRQQKRILGKISMGREMLKLIKGQELVKLSHLEF